MENRVELKKTLKPMHVWALAVGSIIGFGCFVLPGSWLPKAGPMGAAIAFVLGAAFMLVIAYNYGFMIKNFPVAGGEFAYAYEAFGRNHAFVCGWFLTLGYLCLIPSNGSALAVLGRYVAPGFFTHGYMYSIAGWDVYLGEILLASAGILIFGILNYRGVQAVGSIQIVMSALLCGSVLLITAGSFLSPESSFSNLEPLFAPGKSILASVAVVLAIAPFLFVGFDTIPQSAEEFNFSHDKSLKLMVTAIIIGGLMYAAVSLSTAVVAPWQQLIAGKPVWATGQAMHQTLGAFGLLFLMIAVLMAICTGINGFYMATSRLLFSMARSKVIPSFFADVHPKYKTPYKAILFILVISLIAPWFGRQAIIWIVDMCAVGTAIGYLYTCLAPYVLHKSNPGLEGGSKAKIVSVLGSLFSIVFLVLLLVPGSPAVLEIPAWIALAAWVAMGLAFYATMAKRYQQIPKEELDYLVLGELSPNTIRRKV
ncbi:amino acid permease family protein [Desulfocucumis palustris]|uniref:Amino acid permease family protein n=1 Tax=Desulfocucumis palustris TaxID=1898651 RepID=A0A2L2XDL6_9FIRM|nr:APC family permease [Desulfocucumis palustris]GBF34437.1 amino acid permease family protein [Desulfocucumis palustris]